MPAQGNEERKRRQFHAETGTGLPKNSPLRPPHARTHTHPMRPRGARDPSEGRQWGPGGGLPRSSQAWQGVGGFFRASLDSARRAGLPPSNAEGRRPAARRTMDKKKPGGAGQVRLEPHRSLS